MNDDAITKEVNGQSATMKSSILLFDGNDKVYVVFCTNRSKLLIPVRSRPQLLLTTSMLPSHLF